MEGWGFSGVCCGSYGSDGTWFLFGFMVESYGTPVAVIW
jgi:hypothetical protein